MVLKERVISIWRGVSAGGGARAHRLAVRLEVQKIVEAQKRMQRSFNNVLYPSTMPSPLSKHLSSIYLSDL